MNERLGDVNSIPDWRVKMDLDALERKRAQEQESRNEAGDKPVKLELQQRLKELLSKILSR